MKSTMRFTALCLQLFVNWKFFQDKKFYKSLLGDSDTTRHADQNVEATGRDNFRVSSSSET